MNEAGKTVRKLAYHISNEVREKRTSDTIIPKLVVFLHVLLSPICGMFMSVRGAYDGRLSIVGLFLRSVYFILLIVVGLYDDRFEKYEKWARIIPAFFGIVSIGIQMIGVTSSYTCDTNQPISCL